MGARERKRINKSGSHAVLVLLQGRQFSADLKGEPWLSRGSAGVWVDKC